MDSVKQSAALCLLRLYKASPDLVPMGEWTARVVHLLNDQHMVSPGPGTWMPRAAAFQSHPYSPRDPSALDAYVETWGMSHFCPNTHLDAQGLPPLSLPLLRYLEILVWRPEYLSHTQVSRNRHAHP